MTDERRMSPLPSSPRGPSQPPLGFVPWLVLGCFGAMCVAGVAHAPGYVWDGIGLAFILVLILVISGGK